MHRPQNHCGEGLDVESKGGDHMVSRDDKKDNGATNSKNRKRGVWEKKRMISAWDIQI